MMRGRSNNFRVRTTRGQRERLEFLTRGLAELGCGIFTVAKKHRRTSFDRLIVDQSVQKTVLIIRPAPKGIIEIRSYDKLKALHATIHQFLKQHTKELAPRRWIRRLPGTGEERDLDWIEFFDPECYEEARALGFSL